MVSLLVLVGCLVDCCPVQQLPRSLVRMMSRVLWICPLDPLQGRVVLPTVRPLPVPVPFAAVQGEVSLVQLLDAVHLVLALFDYVVPTTAFVGHPLWAE